MLPDLGGANIEDVEGNDLMMGLQLDARQGAAHAHVLLITTLMLHTFLCWTGMWQAKLHDIIIARHQKAGANVMQLITVAVWVKLYLRAQATVNLTTVTYKIKSTSCHAEACQVCLLQLGCR